MAFFHQSLATDGLYPNLVSHFSIATLGAFSIDVIIEPKKPDLGYSDLEYQITVFVSYKGKVWKTQKFVSYFTGHSLEKVLMSFRKLSKRIKDLSVSMTKKSIKSNEVSVTIKPKA